MARMHALILPFPLQGHISPLLQLAQHLAACHGFLITFVNTDYNHGRLLQVSDGDDDEQPRLINMVGLPDSLPIDASRTISNMGRLLHSMAVRLQPLLEQLILDINQSSTPLSCIISDLFLPWVPALGRRTHIPAVLGFHASSVGIFSLFYHIPFLLSSQQVNPDGSVKESVKKLSGIPGLVDVPLAAVPWLVGDAKRIEEMFRVLGTVRTDAALHDGVLFNSFPELEAATIKGLGGAAGGGGGSGGMKIAAVGPMLLLEQAQGVQTSSGQDMGCLKWLDSQAERSVLYVAFGTTAWLSGPDLEALALGLEASKVPFLWVMRSDLLNGLDGKGEGARLPDGFQDRVKGSSAYLTSWAPQTSVLSHPSTAAFLTHGGWNSVIEAISYGVPLLTWPDFSDQKFHGHQVIDEWQIGLPLRPSTDGAAVEQADVERLVRSVTCGAMAEQLRGRCATLREKARFATTMGSGSSARHLQDIIDLVKSKVAAASGMPSDSVES